LYKSYAEHHVTRSIKPSPNAPFNMDSVDGDKKSVYYNRQNHVDDGGFTEADGDKDTAMLMMNGYLGSNTNAPTKESGNGTLKMTAIGPKPNGVENRTGYPGPPPNPPQNGQAPKK